MNFSYASNPAHPLSILPAEEIKARAFVSFKKVDPIFERGVCTARAVLISERISLGKYVELRKVCELKDSFEKSRLGITVLGTS